MCDAGYKVLFTRGDLKVIEGDWGVHGEIVVQGQRDREMGVLTVPLNNTWTSIMSQEYWKQQRKMINNVYKISKVNDIRQYLHAAALSPDKSTFIKAI
jgi:hypothetical protein